MADDLNLEELKRLAVAATPGPWQEFAESGEYWVARQSADGESLEIVMDSGEGNIDQEDVDFVCAANPQTVLRLIAAIQAERVRAETAEARVAELEAAAICPRCGGRDTSALTVSKNKDRWCRSCNHEWSITEAS